MARLRQGDCAGLESGLTSAVAYHRTPNSSQIGLNAGFKSREKGVEHPTTISSFSDKQ